MKVKCFSFTWPRGLILQKQNSGKCFTFKERDIIFLWCFLGNGSSLWAWPQTLCSLSRGRIPATACARWLRNKTCPICITSASNNSPERQWVSMPLRNSQYPSSIRVLSKPPWQMWFFATIRANWNLTKYHKWLKCVHDMFSKNENFLWLDYAELTASSTITISFGLFQCSVDLF